MAKKASQKESKIKKVSDNVYKVESKSKPGTYDTVNSEYGQYNCDCEGFRFRKVCRHVEMVYLLEEETASSKAESK